MTSDDEPHVPGLNPVVLRSLLDIQQLAKRAEDVIRQVTDRRSVSPKDVFVVDSIPNPKVSEKYEFTLDQDWQEDERGNTLLVSSYDDKWNAWIRLSGTGDIRLEISWRPDNYPALNLCLVKCNDEGLYQHLVQQFDQQWQILKLNLNGHTSEELEGAWARKEE